jgi:hypothetical protein
MFAEILEGEKHCAERFKIFRLAKVKWNLCLAFAIITIFIRQIEHNLMENVFAILNVGKWRVCCKRGHSDVASVLEGQTN